MVTGSKKILLQSKETEERDECVSHVELGNFDMTLNFHIATTMVVCCWGRRPNANKKTKTKKKNPILIQKHKFKMLM